jgi:hypothetical protein
MKDPVYRYRRSQIREVIRYREGEPWVHFTVKDVAMEIVCLPISYGHKVEMYRFNLAIISGGRSDVALKVIEWLKDGGE